MAPVQSLGSWRRPSLFILLAALAMSLFAALGCKQKEEPVFKLKAPGVDVEVQKTDKGVDVDVKEKKNHD